MQYLVTTVGYDTHLAGFGIQSNEITSRSVILLEFIVCIKIFVLDFMRWHCNDVAVSLHIYLLNALAWLTAVSSTVILLGSNNIANSLSV